MFDAIAIIGRVIILLLLLYLMIRWLGKKHLTQMTIFEYISGIVLGGVVAIHISSNTIPLLHGVIAILSWTFFIVCIDAFALKSSRFNDFVHGKSKTLIRNGTFMYKQLRHERMTKDTLLESLRTRNIDDLSDVKLAQLEPSGKLNVRTYSEENRSYYNNEDLQRIKDELRELMERMKTASLHSHCDQQKMWLKQLESIHQSVVHIVDHE